jgi:Ras homolog gene family, member A
LSDSGYTVDVKIEQGLVELQLINTWGAEIHDRIRLFSYLGAHIILICFSVVDPESFERVEEKWVQEVCHFCPGIPFLLVGCKTDLRHHRQTIEELTKEGKRPISKDEGEEMSGRIGAKAYLECSAKNGEGVTQVFQTAASIGYPPNVERKQCVVF